MKFPVINFQRDPQANQTAAASVVNPQSGILISQLVNDFSKKSIVEFVFTADNAGGTAAISTIPLFGGVGKNSQPALPAGVTLAGGDYATWADWYGYTQRMDMYVTNIWMQSADSDNFNNKLVTGVIMPNGAVPNETYKQLQNYKVSTGNGYSDNINIPDVPMVIVPNFYANFGLKKNTSIRVQLTIPQIKVAANVAPAAY